MADARKVTGVALLAFGVGFNILDAYFSGNMSFSPATSDQQNNLSTLNRLGGPPDSAGMRLGTILAGLGLAILAVAWIVDY